jgi:predicted transcriptional regulator
MSTNNTIVDMLEEVIQRLAFLNCLDEGAKDKRTLDEELDCSRSTVNRAIRELEALDLVAYEDGGYRITSLGDVVASGVTDLTETIELRLQYEPFLQWMPEEEFDLDLTLLQDAELLLPTQGDPYAMINRHVNALAQAQRMRGILPLTGLHAHKAAHSQIVDNDAEGELVVTPAVATTLHSNPEYAAYTEEMTATGRFTVYTVDEEIPYFVGILDDVVQIGVDEAGEPRAIVETDNAEVRAWAENTFAEYKRQAAPVTLSEETTEIHS